MAEEKTLDQVTSEELFQGAMAPDPVPQEAETPPVQEVAPEATPAAPPEPTPPAASPEPGIPSWRLREEAEGRRQAEERARQLEERLNQIRAQTQKQPDFFENPDQATQAAILRVLQPYAEETQRQMMHNSKLVASALHTPAAVAEAEEAFLKARAEGTLDPADYERVVGSPNRYDAAVQWHKRQAVLTSVGDDPNAWFEKQLEARMADPKFQAKLLEQVRGTAAAKPSAVKIPPSLSRSTAVASNSGEPVGDMSDASLFAYAMGKGR